MTFYDIVREQTSNVSDFIDNILGLKLEILEAKYYTVKTSKDITEKLRDRINNNRLVIDATNQIDGDPDPGTAKKLKIKYSYSGEEFEKEVNEGQTIIFTIDKYTFRCKMFFIYKIYTHPLDS